jgi:hypothetical protein
VTARAHPPCQTMENPFYGEPGRISCPPILACLGGAYGFYKQSRESPRGEWTLSLVCEG